MVSTRNMRAALPTKRTMSQVVLTVKSRSWSGNR